MVEETQSFLIAVKVQTQEPQMYLSEQVRLISDPSMFNSVEKMLYFFFMLKKEKNHGKVITT